MGFLAFPQNGNKGKEENAFLSLSRKKRSSQQSSHPKLAFFSDQRKQPLL